MAYTFISKTELSSSTTAVVIGSIPNTYAHLQLQMDMTVDSDFSPFMRINNSTSSYYQSGLRSENTFETYFNTTSVSRIFLDEVTSTTPAGNLSFIVDCLDYTNTNIRTTLCWRGGQANYYTSFGTALWTNNTAITQLSIQSFTGNILAGSTFTLWGVTA